MARPYSSDLRARVVEAVDAGATRYEAAERFGISVASAVRWHQAWRNEGTIEAKPALTRNPAVAKHLQVEAQAELQSLTPRAIRTIAGLLTHKSGLYSARRRQGSIEPQFYWHCQRQGQHRPF